MNRLFAFASMLGVSMVVLAGPAEASRPRPGRPPRVQRVTLVTAPVTREIAGNLCATTERAEVDARKQLSATVRDWLADSGVDREWAPPAKLVDRMVIGRPSFEPVKVKELDVVRATLTADFSEGRKREFLEVYRRHTGGRRLAILGGGLLVVLAGLAAVSGYIRADDATKGYYTNRLRLLAAAGVGAAGVAVYRILT